MAERMLGAFLEAVRPGKILGVEESFAVEPVEGILVTGIVDLVELKDGHTWIVDAKTGKNSPSDAFDKEQIGLYRLGLEEIGLVPEGMPVGLRYDVLRKLKSRSEFVSIEVETSEKELADLRQKLNAISGQSRNFLTADNSRVQSHVFECGPFSEGRSNGKPWISMVPPELRELKS
jgi:hypothetical protein